jgi:hypothetical protein
MTTATAESPREVASRKVMVSPELMAVWLVCAALLAGRL